MKLKSPGLRNISILSGTIKIGSMVSSIGTSTSTALSSLRLGSDFQRRSVQIKCTCKCDNPFRDTKQHKKIYFFVDDVLRLNGNVYFFPYSEVFFFNLLDLI